MTESMCNLITSASIIFLLMEKKPSKLNEKEKPNWDWTHVQCYLKTAQANRKSFIWNLSPSIILTNPSTDTSGPSVRLYIDTEKSLQYSHDLGWNWHKSWNIPNISLRLQIKDQNSGDFLLSPRNLYAQIFAVKKNGESQKNDRMTLIDVGIRGESKMEMIDGQVYFSAIKFSSTTYNNQGIDFNMLIVLYINQGEFEKPKVLTAVMSPPIFVDSRRSARDYQEKKFSSFVQPFGYDTIEKEFIKREIIIKNDPEGFYNYITAPNIRHKVKHPVFLAIKFSNCVKIYYNNKLVTNTNTNELLENMQHKLLKEIKNKQKTDLELATNLEEKYFVFAISNLTDSLKRKKVIESIETMQNEFIGIACGSEELPDCLEPLPSIETIKKAYKESYQALVAICQNYEPEDQDESEDEYYSEQYDESERSSTKKKKEAEPARPKNKTTIISNKNPPVFTEKPAKIQKNDEIILKKQQLYDSQFQAPVFFNNQNQQARKACAAASAFSKAVGFRNVSNPSDNNPIFDTTQLNKAFSNNLGNLDFNENPQPNFLLEPKNTAFKSANKTEPNQLMGQNNPLLNQQMLNNPLGCSTQNISPGLSQSQSTQGMAGNFGMGGNFNNSIYENLLYSNLTLSNWLSSVKGNNNSLYDSMNHSLSDQMLHKNNLERYLQNEQKMLELNRMPLHNEQQQSIVCLIQQIGLYKELLAQVSYQNQLLTRDISMKQQHNPLAQFQNLQPMNYHMGPMAGMNLALNNLNMNSSNMNNMNNSNMNNTGMPNMGNHNTGMPNMGNLSCISQGHLNNNLLNNQMNLVNNMMLNQSRSGETSTKEKELTQGMSQPTGSNLSQSMSQSSGGMKERAVMGMSTNYEIIKNMVLDEIKREAEMKERERQESK